MHFDPLSSGILRRRYKRFLADIRLENGDEITVHCPNTGAMTGCAEPGSPVWLARSANAARKYPFTWELVQTAWGLACIHSARANALTAEAIVAGRVPELGGYAQLRREVKFGSEGSRCDLQLSEGTGSDCLVPDCLVEVKCVTLCMEDGIGLFPDAVSARGARHLRELAAVRALGQRAVMLFCVQHTGIRSVAPADDIDPAYGVALRAAVAAGVEVLAYAADISPAGMQLERRLPVLL